MNPNFVPTFDFNQEVEILDETGYPTGRHGYVHARYHGKDDIAEYAVMLSSPPGGSRHFPAAQIQPVVKPAAPRVQHGFQRKRRARQADSAATEIIVLTGPPLPKQIASAATPRRRAPQVNPHPRDEDAQQQNSTDPASASSRGGAK